MHCRYQSASEIFGSGLHKSLVNISHLTFAGRIRCSWAEVLNAGKIKRALLPNARPASRPCPCCSTLVLLASGAERPSLIAVVSRPHTFPCAVMRVLRYKAVVAIINRGLPFNFLVHVAYSPNRKGFSLLWASVH